jgi:hypothetical protein
MATAFRKHRYHPRISPALPHVYAGRTVSLGGQRRSLAGYFDLKKPDGDG